MKAIKFIFYILVLSLFSSCLMTDFLFNDDNVGSNRETQGAFYATIEEAVLDELNFARTKPKQYAEKVLKPKLSRFNGKIYDNGSGVGLMTNEGATAVQEAIRALNSQRPLQSLSLDADLSKASHLLAEYQAKSGRAGHYGPNGMSMQQRIEKFGKWSGGIGENCAYGTNTAREIVAQLIIDDGVLSRGHRKNILNGSFNKVGISYIKNGNAPYGSVCVMDFAGSFVGY